MFATATARARITRLAWATAWATLVVGQLHALARFRTEDGVGDLDLPLTRAWAVPAGRVVDPLLAWSDPDTVYLTYGKWWLPAFVVVAVAGAMVARHRAPEGVERWAWRLFIGGFGALALGAGTFYWGQWTSYNALADVGLWLDLPGALLSLIGATVLGAVLLRRGDVPRLPAALLLLAIPGALLIIQATSLGNADLPIMFAVAMLASATTGPPTARRHDAAPVSGSSASWQ